MYRPKVSNPGLKFKKDGVISHSIPNFQGVGVGLWGGKTGFMYCVPQ